MRFEETLGISHELKILSHELLLAIEKRLLGLKISLPQYTALSCLEEKESATNAELARKSSVTPQTMIRIMRNLEKSNLVSKKAQNEHGLKQDFRLTNKGRNLICKAHIEVNAVEELMIKNFSKDEYVNLKLFLDKCLKTLRDSSPP